jgi:Lrp/AsnC family transcriptional regulator for asnA, asnC and gidA
MELDDVDLNILAMLQDNARTPFMRIAKKLDLSDATIHLRVRKMEQMGIIERYTVVLNEKVGKPIVTYVLLRISPGTIEDVCARLMDIDAAYEICEIHERYDILVKIRGQNLDDIRNVLINKIRAIPNVVGSEAYTVFKTWKHDWGLQVKTT